MGAGGMGTGLGGSEFKGIAVLVSGEGAWGGGAHDLGAVFGVGGAYLHCPSAMGWGPWGVDFWGSSWLGDSRSKACSGAWARDPPPPQNTHPPKGGCVPPADLKEDHSHMHTHEVSPEMEV